MNGYLTAASIPKATKRRSSGVSVRIQRGQFPSSNYEPDTAPEMLYNFLSQNA